MKSMKQWGQLKGENSWTMFKVISEFVDGFETLNRLGPCVSIFGSARVKPDHPHYQLAEKIAARLTEEGFGVITGGGPGIMEAANKGAKLNNGLSVGLNIDLPFEQSSNPYIDHDKNLNHRFFFRAKSELFEVLTLTQTGKIHSVPIILVGKEFWTPLKNWIVDTMLEKNAYISPQDLDLMPIVDDAEEIVSIINTFYEGDKGTSLQPTFEL